MKINKAALLFLTVSLTLPISAQRGAQEIHPQSGIWKINENNGTKELEVKITFFKNVFRFGYPDPPGSAIAVEGRTQDGINYDLYYLQKGTATNWIIYSSCKFEKNTGTCNDKTKSGEPLLTQYTRLTEISLTPDEVREASQKLAHDDRIAVFKRESLKTLSAAQRGYGTETVNQIAKYCFQTSRGRPIYAQCKGFILTGAQSRTLSRADVANGITSVVDVKSTVLKTFGASGPWNENRSCDRFIKVNIGPWKHNNSFSNC